MRNYFFLGPFLFAIYSVLFLYAKNQREYRLEVILIPLIISLIFTSIVFFITKLIFKKLDISAIVTTVLVFVCLSYGRFLELGEDSSIKLGSIKLDSEVIVGVTVSVILVILFFIIFKFRAHLRNVNKALTVIIALLLAFQIFNISVFELKSGRIWRPTQTKGPIKTNTSAVKVSNPDIYYFIFDRYAGPTALSEQYKFDNSKLFNFLTKKGFYLAKEARTNYPKTFLSLGSSLNMEYLDFLTEQTNGGGSGDESIVTPLIRNSKVLAYLKDNGYKYVHMGSWWEPTKRNPNADNEYFFRFEEYWGADEFTAGFYDLTIVRPILKSILKDPVNVSKVPRNNSHRQAALYQFKEFEKIPDLPGPKFVFVHILLPHDPFVFDKSCNPISEVVVKKNTHQVNYLNQLQCTNTQIEKIINNIFAKSKNPPIIILQSDEGPFPMNVSIPKNQSWGSAETTSLREKFPILNAYYFPNKDYTGLYDTITPVNSFKVLFNTYFGTNHELLPDKNYVFQDDDNYYKFKDITDLVK